MTVTEHDHLRADIHPIDMVETLAESCDWEFDRVGENQIAMAIEAQWRTYSLTLAWSGSDDILRLIATAEFAPEEERLAEFHKLLNLINDRIWCGCFSHWAEQELLAFRYGLTLAGGADATPEQIETMVLNAVALFERFYPAIQLVCFAGETAERAAEIAIGEHYGTA